MHGPMNVKLLFNVNHKLQSWKSGSY